MQVSIQQIAHILQPILAKLAPTCKRIDLAGSCRRQEHWISDIDIICEPMETEEDLMDLFGGVSVASRVKEWGKAVRSIGNVTKGDVDNGRMVSVRLSNGIKIDLFMPLPEDYYRQLAIRTGSTEFVKNIIAARWVARGWVGTSDGLRRIEDCERVGERWRVKKGHIATEIPPAWKSEVEFFGWLGLQWKYPWAR